MRPLVSVVIPTYNRAEQLTEALDSVHGQKGCGTVFDTEVIVVDDASPDRTADVARQYPTVRYIRLDVNQGPSAARNTGIKASTGKYLAFLDDDDLWLPDRLLVEVTILEGHPEIGVALAQDVFNGEAYWGATWPIPGEIWPSARTPSGHVFDALLLEDFLAFSTLLVRREVIDRAGLFDERIRGMEHYEFVLRLSFHTSCVFIAVPLNIHRSSSRGVWGSSILDGSHERDLSLIVERALAMLPETPDSADLKRKARASILWRAGEPLRWLGDAPRLRAFLLTQLGRNPSAILYPTVQALVRWCATRIVLDSEDPLASFRDFQKSIHGTVGGAQDVSLRRVIRHEQARIWLETAVDVMNDLRRLDRVAAYSAVCAVISDPRRLSQPPLLKCLARGVFPGPRWDWLFRTLRALRKRGLAARH